MRAFALVWLVALLGATPAGADVPLETVPARSLLDDLREGRKVVRDHLRVTGPLDLSSIDAVTSLFKCRLCTFEKDVSAPDMTFMRTVDLSGSTFMGAVDFHGTTFRGPALFRATTEETTGEERPAVFQGSADFSLAVFGEFASFGRSLFEKPAQFQDTRFADVAFASTEFETVAFDRASFRGAALFNSTTFTGRATFDEADFRGRTDFSLAPFERGASFVGSQFAQGASFLGTDFYTAVADDAKAEEIDEANATGAFFQNVASAGSLDFTFAQFVVARAPSRVRVAVFEDVVCGRSLVFRDATFAEERRIGMTRLQVGGLVLDVDAVDRIDDEDDRQRALETIEQSAKASGDLQIANEARYSLQKRRAEGYSPIGQLLDGVFYRGFAGYLVRPTHPIFTLLGLATLMSVIRTARSHEPAPPAEAQTSRRRRLWRRVRRRGSEFLNRFFDTFAQAAPRLSGRGDNDPSVGIRLERLAYRVLGVCALISLANSNPTLRAMVDTLF